MTTTISVPGKLILMGEHAVVYGRPCLVTAVNPRMIVKAEILNESVFKLEAPDVNISQYQKSITDIGSGEIPKEAKFAEIALYNFSQKYKIEKGINIITQSDFSSNSGFGSSAATVVGVMKAVAESLSVKLTEKELFDLSYKTVVDVQGIGSGFDIAAAVYGGTIYFKNTGEVTESLTADGMNLVVGYSGIKADTVEMVKLVSVKKKNYSSGIEKIFDNISGLVDEAKRAISEKDWVRLGTLMNYNQNYLEDLGVSTDKLNLMIEAAQKTGAYGAKLSGAGGGDCMIALVAPKNRENVSQAIKRAGGEIIEVSVNAEGVKAENI